MPLGVRLNGVWSEGEGHGLCRPVPLGGQGGPPSWAGRLRRFAVAEGFVLAWFGASGGVRVSGERQAGIRPPPDTLRAPRWADGSARLGFPGLWFRGLAGQPSGLLVWGRTGGVIGYCVICYSASGTNPFNNWGYSRGLALGLARRHITFVGPSDGPSGCRLDGGMLSGGGYGGGAGATGRRGTTTVELGA